MLVGNSMGGTLSILQAANEPSTVKSLILSSPVVPIARGGFPSPAVVAAFALYRTPGLGELFGRFRIKGLPPEREVALGFRMTAADPSRIGPEVVAAHVEMTRVRHRNPDAVPAFLEAARSLLFLVARPRLARELMDRVSCPVLMIQGSQDKLVPAAFGRATAGAYPAWDFRLVKDAGHVVQIELPEQWLTEVEPWVTAVVAPRPAARA